MKKMTLLIFTLLLAVLYGCTSTDGTTVSQPVSDVAEGVSAVSGDGMFVLPHADVKSYDDYLELINNDPKLPDDFVRFDAISDIGKFCRLKIYQNNDYEYEISDRSGLILCLSFVARKTGLINSEMEGLRECEGIDGDLSTLEEDVFNKLPKISEIIPDAVDYSRYYYHGGILYTYLDKQCYAIYWICGERQVMLFGLDHKPLNGHIIDVEDTFVSKLLNSSTAKETIESFNSSIC